MAPNASPSIPFRTIDRLSFDVNAAPALHSTKVDPIFAWEKTRIDYQIQAVTGHLGCAARQAFANTARWLATCNTDQMQNVLSGRGNIGARAKDGFDASFL